MLLLILEWLVVVGVFAVAITQVIVPIVRGTVLWPWFRSEEHRLLREQAQVQQREVEEEVRSKIRNLKTRLLKKEKIS